MSWPKTPTKHGHATRAKGISPTYRTWQAMISRCTNVSVKSYEDYGARGITVYAGWLVFENFLADMGLKPSTAHSLDRKDNNGNYTPKNCRWATKSQQYNNYSRSVFMTAFGIRKTVKQWADNIGVRDEVLKYRIDAGWPHEIAVTKQVRKQSNNSSFIKPFVPTKP